MAVSLSSNVRWVNGTASHRHHRAQPFDALFQPGGLVTSTETFPIRNGQTTGTVDVGPLSPGSFSCPGGQRLFLQSVCYDDITLSGEGATAGPFFTDTELCHTFGTNTPGLPA